MKNNSVLVTKEDVIKEINSLNSVEQIQAKKNINKTKEIMNRLYRRKAMQLAIAKSNVSKDPEVQYLIEIATTNVLVNALKEKMISGLTVPNFAALAKIKYTARPSDYIQKSRIRVSHIYKKINQENNEEAVYEKINNLLQKLHDGESFDDIASNENDDGTRVDKGNLGWIDKGKTVKVFQKAAYALKNIDDITSVIKTKFGYHIIRLDEKQKEHVKPYKLVRPYLIKELKDKYFDEKYQQWQRDVFDLDNVKLDLDNIYLMLNEINPLDDKTQGKKK